ncbi:MAG: ABC transporter substrate-binding protein [Bacteroidetes bacterium]|nr:ABC transporter substrate-binding protein [Bacteroidota bacterium]
MIELKDQMNRTIRLEKIPERIVSLVPSQTELLYHLGLGDRVVGITKFCIHPDTWYQSKKRVGGTKTVNHAVIDTLKPDLVIGNKEENSMEDILKLAEKYPVYMSDIFTTDDALQMILAVGTLTAKVEHAAKLVQRIQLDFSAFPTVGGTVLYLIWAKPFMAVGNHTFIGDMLQKFGLQNIVAGDETRYVELTQEQLSVLKPDYVFLSSEPYPFKQPHADALRKITAAEIVLVDGEMFSWYGSRMAGMKDYFTQLSRELKGNLP